jgi:hypothetical protein
LALWVAAASCAECSSAERESTCSGDQHGEGLKFLVLYHRTKGMGDESMARSRQAGMFDSRTNKGYKQGLDRTAVMKLAVTI